MALISFHGDATRNETKSVESSATMRIKSEDLKNSHSHDYDPTLLMKIEDALQAESYECKEEFLKDLHRCYYSYE
jgi:hypothetical protein